MISWFTKKKSASDEVLPDPAVENGDAPEAAPQTGADETAAAAGNGPATAAAKRGFFQRLQAGLAKTRQSLVSRVDALFLGRKEIDAGLLDELEEILITADLGVSTTMDLLEEIRARVSRRELKDPAALKEALQENLAAIFRASAPAPMEFPASGPLVMMVVGVNGVGKTTTIGKIAARFSRAGKRVLLVAADTFRAAAIDQLKVWGRRVGAEVAAREQGVDPAAVVYEALDHGAGSRYDVIIIDTAGRLHTKVNLMEELKKIKRVIGKKVVNGPHEVMLILDATTGQNSISQAKLFDETVGLTGLTLTKLDGTAKGGIVINITHDLHIPIRFIGIGEKIDDLRDFDPDEFIKALFGDNSAAS
jgi:fused signal recognition particle receptor